MWEEKERGENTTIRLFQDHSGTHHTFSSIVSFFWSDCAAPQMFQIIGLVASHHDKLVAGGQAFLACSKLEFQLQRCFMEDRLLQSAHKRLTSHGNGGLVRKRRRRPTVSKIVFLRHTWACLLSSREVVSSGEGCFLGRKLLNSRNLLSFWRVLAVTEPFFKRLQAVSIMAFTQKTF